MISDFRMFLFADIIIYSTIFQKEDREEVRDGLSQKKDNEEKKGAFWVAV